MKEIYKECKPTVCGDDLLSGDNVFMTKEIIREQCECVNKSVCLQIVDLLNNKHREEAKALIK